MPNRSATFETNHGTFTVELFEQRAPKTTGNFIDLAKKGFYDGLVFHRVIEGFMIQGGVSTDARDRPREEVVMETVRIE